MQLCVPRCCYCCCCIDCNMPFEGTSVVQRRWLTLAVVAVVLIVHVTCQMHDMQLSTCAHCSAGANRVVTEPNPCSESMLTRTTSACELKLEGLAISLYVSPIGRTRPRLLIHSWPSLLLRIIWRIRQTMHDFIGKEILYINRWATSLQTYWWQPLTVKTTRKS